MCCWGFQNSFMACPTQPYETLLHPKKLDILSLCRLWKDPFDQIDERTPEQPLHGAYINFKALLSSQQTPFCAFVGCGKTLWTRLTGARRCGWRSSASPTPRGRRRRTRRRRRKRRPSARLQGLAASERRPAHGAGFDREWRSNLS